MRGSKPGERRGGRQKGTPNKATTATADFFHRVLTDERESELWKFFLDHGDPEIKFKAFRLSLEYKRGKPVQPMEHTGADGGPVEHTIKFGDGRA
jgi:hypothetical protein